MSTFIQSLYKDGRYQLSMIGSGLAGLRKFLSANAHVAQFFLEIPVHLPLEVKITEIYSGKELATHRSMFSSGVLTKRTPLSAGSFWKQGSGELMSVL